MARYCGIDRRLCMALWARYCGIDRRLYMALYMGSLLWPRQTPLYDTIYGLVIVASTDASMWHYIWARGIDRRLYIALYMGSLLWHRQTSLCGTIYGLAIVAGIKWE